MPNDTITFSGLPASERLLLAQGGALVSPASALRTMVSLAADQNHEIREPAAATLRQIPDERCAEWLKQPDQSRAVLRYFLDPLHLRVSLLPLLLGHPESPEDAVTALAGLADATIAVTLLENLDLLRTSSL